MESRSVAPIDPASRLFAQTIATMRKMNQRRDPPSVREANKPPEEVPVVPPIDPNSRLFAHTTATIRKRNERKEHKPDPYNWSKFFTQSYAAPKLDTADTYSRLLVPATPKTMPGPYQPARSVASEPIPRRQSREEVPVVPRIDPSSRLFAHTTATARKVNTKKEYKPEPHNWSRFFAKSYETPKVDTADTYSRLLVPATTKTMPGPHRSRSVVSEPIPAKTSLNRSATASTAPSSRGSLQFQDPYEDEGNEPPEESECPDGETSYADDEPRSSPNYGQNVSSGANYGQNVSSGANYGQNASSGANYGQNATQMAPQAEQQVQDTNKYQDEEFNNYEEDPNRDDPSASEDNNLDADLGNYARSAGDLETQSQNRSQFALPDSDDEDGDGELYMALTNGEGIEKLREKKLEYYA